MRIASEQIKAVILDGQEYEPQELKDLVTQLELEATDNVGNDFIIFREEKYGVRKATYDVIRNTKNSLIFTRYAKEIYKQLKAIEAGEDSSFIPKLDRKPFRRVREAIEDFRYKKSWLKLCKLTFINDHTDFALGGLTQGEVERVMRVFFRFQAELFQDVHAELKKVSPDTLNQNSQEK